MVKPEISIIVPVYGVEKYIKKCLNSVLNQTFKNFEVIVVDDGSLDESISIAKELCNEDPRFLFVQQANSGLSAARNFGLSFANGTYVIYLDSDDYWHHEFLNEMVSSAYDNKAPHDVVISSCFLVNERDDVLKKIRPRKQVLSNITAVRESLLSSRIKPLAQLMLIKREIATLYKFPLDCYYEDRSTTLKYLYMSKTVILCDTAIYYYLQRDGSIMSTLNIKKITDRMLVMKHIYDFLVSNNVYDKFKFEYDTCFLNTIVSAGFKQILKTDGRNKEYENLLLKNIDFERYSIITIFKMLISQPIKTILILSLIKMPNFTMKLLNRVGL